MESIRKGVWELKTANDRTWYRLIYLTRIDDAFYVLHAFEKSTRKTDRRDLEIAKSRLRSVLAQLRTAKEEGNGQKD
jgi:phage-related protein